MLFSIEQVSLRGMLLVFMAVKRLQIHLILVNFLRQKKRERGAPAHRGAAHALTGQVGAQSPSWAGGGSGAVLQLAHPAAQGYSRPLAGMALLCVLLSACRPQCCRCRVSSVRRLLLRAASHQQLSIGSQHCHVLHRAQGVLKRAFFRA